MSATSTSTRRAAIDTATRAARDQAIRRRERRAQLVEAAYEQFSDQLGDWLREHADQEGRVPPEALGAFDAWVEASLRRLNEQWSQLLGEGLAEAASLGAALLDGGGESIAQRTLQYLDDFIAADGLQLSDRVWRVNQATRQTITDAIRGTVMRGATARQAADALIAEGKPVPAELALQVRAAVSTVLDGDTRNALLRSEGAPLRNALRVLRTELNRAYTESFVSSAFEHPDSAAVKFNLSPAHPRPDICDFHASANLHGMGPGVYPRGAHPYPAHPETLSYLTVVFTDEIGAAAAQAKQTPFEWLSRQPATLQDAVLGVNKGAAFRAGQLRPAEFDTPWRQIKARLGGEP